MCNFSCNICKKDLWRSKAREPYVYGGVKCKPDCFVTVPEYANSTGLLKKD